MALSDQVWDYFTNIDYILRYINGQNQFRLFKESHTEQPQTLYAPFYRPYKFSTTFAILFSVIFTGINIQFQSRKTQANNPQKTKPHAKISQWPLYRNICSTCVIFWIFINRKMGMLYNMNTVYYHSTKKINVNPHINPCEYSTW